MKKVRKVAPARRRLGVESLERRELLAGNVAVSLRSGFLTVTGDNNANQITIFQQPNGRFDIVGLDDEVFTGPTTNLSVRNIIVNANGGDDSVTISAEPNPFFPVVIPAQILGSVTVNGGNGADAINVSVIGRLAGAQAIPNLFTTVDGGAGSDTVNIVNTATSLLTVNTGSGIDIIDLTNVLTLTTTVNSGDQDDGVTLNTVTALTATISLGSSSSNPGNVLNIDTGLFGTLYIYGGASTDSVGVANTLAGFSLWVYTYNGNDQILMDTVQTGLTTADYQFLADQVIQAFGLDISQLPFNLNALIARLPGMPGYFWVSSGEGNDVVDLNQVFSTFYLWVSLDGGNDDLTATAVDATYAYLYGGLGSNGLFADDVDATWVLLFDRDLPDPDDQGGV